MTLEPLEGIPIFCVQTSDKIAGQECFINFKSTNQVEHPELDLDEDQLVRELCNPIPSIENFKIPMKLSQIFWTKGTNSERNYVIDVHINDKFAIRRILVSEVIRHYVITAAMQTVEEKYNGDFNAKACGQFIGHKLDLFQSDYVVLTDKQSMEKTNELVNNKIIFVDDPKSSLSSGKGDTSDINTFDLHFRPASSLLTCSINTDKLPDSIGFNDDRIIIKSGDKSILDVYLPFSIDLKTPVKYKFDDNLCLFRAVFKIVEC